MLRFLLSLSYFYKSSSYSPSLLGSFSLYSPSPSNSVSESGKSILYLNSIHYLRLLACVIADYNSKASKQESKHFKI